MKLQCCQRLLEKAGLKVGVDATIVPMNPGTEIAAMLPHDGDRSRDAGGAARRAARLLGPYDGK